MANADIPNGFVPIGKLGASEYSGEGNWYYCPTSSATAIYKNDFVQVVTNSAGTTQNIKAAVAAGAVLLGSAQEFSTTDPEGDVTSLLGNTDITPNEYRAAGVAGWVFVTDDPYMLYVGQSSSTTGTADLGLNADILATGGNTSTLTSQMEIKTSGAGTATAQVRIVKLARQADGLNTLSSNSSLVVMINEHAYKGGTGT